MTKKKISKIGRPKAPQGKAKTVMFQFRVTPAEKTAINVAAALDGKRGPIWARNIVLAKVGVQ